MARRERLTSRTPRFLRPGLGLGLHQKGGRAIFIFKKSTAPLHNSGYPAILSLDKRPERAMLAADPTLLFSVALFHHLHVRPKVTAPLFRRWSSAVSFAQNRIARPATCDPNGPDNLRQTNQPIHHLIAPVLLSFFDPA